MTFFGTPVTLGWILIVTLSSLVGFLAGTATLKALGG